MLSSSEQPDRGSFQRVARPLQRCPEPTAPSPTAPPDAGGLHHCCGCRSSAVTFLRLLRRPPIPRTANKTKSSFLPLSIQGPKLTFPTPGVSFLDTRPHTPYKLTTEVHHPWHPGDITPLSPGHGRGLPLEYSSDVHHHFSLPSFEQPLGGQYTVSSLWSGPHPPPSPQEDLLPPLGARSPRASLLQGSQH